MHRPALLDISTLLSRPRGVLVLSSLMYLAAALHPVLLGPLGWPSMEVLWSAMLVPTIAISFYYGPWGAGASVLVAFALFLGVERVAHGPAAFDGERLVFGLTILLAIVVLGIAIGGLADLLRREHLRRVLAERAAATSEMAVALKHEIHNPLAALVAEAQMLREDANELPEAHRQSVSNLNELAERVQALVDRVAEIDEPKRVEYLEGRWMTDLSED